MTIFKALGKMRRLLNNNQKKNAVFLYIITLISACLEVVGVSLMIPLMTAVLSPNILETSKFAALLAKVLRIKTSRSFVVICIVVLIAVFIIKDLFLIFDQYVRARFVYNNKYQTQCRLQWIFMRKPYEYFLSSSSGDILKIISTDVDMTYQTMVNMMNLFSELIVSAALIVTVSVINFSMTLAIVGVLAILALIINRKIKPILQKKGEEYGVYARLSINRLYQSIRGIKDIKITRSEEFFRARFAEAEKKRISVLQAHDILENSPRMLIEMGCVCSTLAIIGVMVLLGVEMESLVPTLGAFAMAALKLMPAATRIVYYANNIAFCENSVDKVIELVEDESDTCEQDEKRDCVHSMTFEKEIEFSKISFRYMECADWILKDASLKIPIGKSIGIIGKSGAGKTTAVDVMLGLLKPQEGEILVDGVNIQTDYSEWLSHIGCIPQTIFLIDDTIEENVCFGSKLDEGKLRHALKEAQLEEFINTLPNGVRTKIGECGVRLSGGQRQRIGIARAIYNDPDILFFDEATSSLDGETEQALLDSINHFHGKKTMVIIAHRSQTIEHCDVVYSVQNGKFIAERNSI